MLNIIRFVLLALAVVASQAAPAQRAYAGERETRRLGHVELAQGALPNWAGGLTGAAKDEGKGSNGSADKSPSGASPQATGQQGASPAPAANGEAAGSGAPAPAAAAPQPLPAQLEAVLQPVRRISTLLDEFEKTVERVKDRDDGLARVRTEIDKLPAEARAAIGAIQPRLAEIKAQIDKLGPAPKSDEPPESAEVAAERARLNGLASQLDGAIKSAELGDVRARQLIGRVQDLRQSIFASQVLSRTKHSPLSPSLWRTVADELPSASGEIIAIAKGWWTSASSRKGELLAIITLTALVFFGLRLLRRKVIVGRLGPVEGRTTPTFAERAAVASWVAPAVVLPGAAAAAILYIALESNDLLYLQTRNFAGVVLRAVLIGVVVFGLSWAILQPRRGAWRLFNLSDRSASRLNMLVRLAVVAYAIDLVLRDVINMLYLPFQVSVAQAFTFSLLFAGLLFALARTPIEPRTPVGEAFAAEGASEIESGEEESEDSAGWMRWLRLPLVLLALFITGSALAGFVALARFVSAQVMLTGTVVVFIILTHLGIRAIAGDRGIQGEQAAGVGTRVLAGHFKLAEAQQRQMDRFVYSVLNVLLAIIAIPMVLYVWGASTADIVALFKSALFGFDVGGIRIAPSRILLAVGLFVLLLAATRLLQRWLKATLLQPSRIDSGLANSIHTGVGYAGFALAALAAVSYGGLDITNIAIVAGALSVGIGFGLQSIVNNFVSGLILLVERPIKVGDWIGVGPYEGHVRRISVRSTEIETFDRSSVIVPNSELISGTVKNRTHRNALGRVDVAIGVSYKSDPEQVKELLEKVAQESTMVLKFPAPVVSFDNFAASSLDFTVRAYVADVNKSIGTSTDLRLRIFKALNEAGIEIPFPQQDVHLRDLDLVKAMVARLAAERAAKAASVTDEPVEDEESGRRTDSEAPHKMRTG